MNRDDVMVRPPAWARGVNRAIGALAGFLGRIYLRMEVIGTERIPASGGFVFAPTHRSNIDFLLAGLASPRRVRWMAKHTIFKGGLIDRFLVNMGAFPVNRDTADRTALDICERLIDHGEVVVMFPEGRRKDGDRIEDVFRGPAFVSARRRVPIVPMGIGGSDAAMPIGKKVVRPRKVVMIIGEPIYPDVPLEGRVSRVMIDATTERLTDSLQRLYDEARALAGQG